MLEIEATLPEVYLQPGEPLPRAQPGDYSHAFWDPAWGLRSGAPGLASARLCHAQLPQCPKVIAGGLSSREGRPLRGFCHS